MKPIFYRERNRKYRAAGPGVCAWLAALVLMALSASCSDSNVPCEDVQIPVHLTIHHELEWTDTVCYPQGYFARAGMQTQPCRVRYEIRAYPKGRTSGPCRRFSFYRDDLTLSDFRTDIKLPMGDWDIYAWQDLVTEGQEPYYNLTDFASIGYISPYRGDTDHRDCFRGTTPISVPARALATGSVDGSLTLTRPTGKYVFIATDYNEFLEKYGTKGPGKFSVVAIYATFMPSLFDNFTDRVADSEPNMRYNAEIQPLGNGRAAIALDYVFMNPAESGVQVQLALQDPDGELSALTDVITVPLRRSRITYIEGAFLTAKGSSGINIDFGFAGDINIKL